MPVGGTPSARGRFFFYSAFDKTQRVASRPAPMAIAWVGVDRLVVVRDIVRLWENSNGLGVIWLGFDKFGKLGTYE